MSRAPNTGPYVVTWETHQGEKMQLECQTWGYACSFMRRLLVMGAGRVSVAFT